MTKRIAFLFLLLWTSTSLLWAQNLQGKCFSNPSAGVEYRICPENCIFVNDPRVLSRALELGQEQMGVPDQFKPAVSRLGLQFYVYVRPPQGQKPTANFNLLTEDLPPDVTSTAQYGKLSLAMTQQVVSGFKQLAPPKSRNIGGKMFDGMEFEGLIQGQSLRFRSYYCVDNGRRMAYVITLTDSLAGSKKSFPILEAALSGVQLGIAGGQG